MKKQGNISILVLFVLIASSLMGVLTMNFVNQMLSSSNTMVSYYTSYYLSHAGLELLLTEAKHRGIGFELTIGTGSSIFAQNFACEDCDFTAKMQGTSKIVSKEFWKETSESCLSPIVLEQGQSLMIPLIKDTLSGTTAQAFVDAPKYENLSINLGGLQFTHLSGGINPEVNVGLIVLSGDELLSDGIFVRTGAIGPLLMQDFVSAWESYANNILPIPGSNQNLSYYYTKQLDEYPFKNYFILANTQADTISFCINSDTPLPTDNFHITSNGIYHGQTIGLELIYKQPIPNFLLNSVLSQ